MFGVHEQGEKIMFETKCQRFCITVRSHLKFHKKVCLNCEFLNIVIALISRYFQQSADWNEKQATAFVIK